MDDTSAREILIHIRGTVQGVGFRPFIARLAEKHSISGWVRNDRQGVTIRARQTAAPLDRFVELIRSESPAAARIEQLWVEDPATVNDGPASSAGKKFIILESAESAGPAVAAVTPDLAICAECRTELLDPSNRRHAYPFINCTNCGPRYSIIEALPYDRERTTMSRFTMCGPCDAEYHKPADRRYHAQPNACPDCGPALFLADAGGDARSRGGEALADAVEALKRGRIVAVKGIGGFHLFALAEDAEAVGRLRQRKHRDEKPFAVMFADIPALREHALVSPGEEALLQSPAAPIVLVKRIERSSLAKEIAPGNPWIGAILPYAPLHILLMKEMGCPLIATSANLSEEPLCTGNEEALGRLNGIADLLLTHDRPIARPVDDSVQRITRHGPVILRRARGYAPTPFPLPEGLRSDKPVLSVGGHLKNTVAVAMADQVVISPHIGDLSNKSSIEAFEKTIDLLLELYGGSADAVVCDLHPDYNSSRFAESTGLPVTRVQHHLAHILACLLEHGGGPDRVLGVAWDGTGYGEDGTIWGGEFILVDRTNGSARRVAHLKPFRLPGGEAAVRRTGRCALGALHAAGLVHGDGLTPILSQALGDEADHLPLLWQALAQAINAPLTSSAGRLFDATAALLGLARENRFEGQAGMAMEFAAERSRLKPDPFPFALHDSTAQPGAMEIDWSPTMEALLAAARSGANPSDLSMRFHASLAGMIAAVAQAVGLEAVALTGGCFQNAVLGNLATEALNAAGHNVLLHRRLSPNDNSIAAGQAFAFLAEITRVES